MTKPGEPARRSETPATSDVAALRAALTIAERRAATLAELAALMNEGRNPLALAQRAVELTARATKAAGAFVYLWDGDDERLVLRVATEGWQRGHLDRIKLRIGEGVTGWVALMRQAVMLPEDPRRDPRFKPFPELRESTFKSMIAVPIVAPGEDVLGVFTLYARTESAFADTDVGLASEVGSLLASGLVQAETVTQLQIQSSAAQFLRHLPDETWGSLESCLRMMSAQCVIDLDADACLIEVTTDHAQPLGGMSAVAMSERFRDAQSDRLEPGGLDKTTLADLIEPLDLHRLRIPLGAAAPIGALTCFRTHRFTPEDELLLEGIGAQVAAGALSLYGTERVRPIIDELLFSPNAVTTEHLLKRYGWDSRPTWPTVLRVHSSAHVDEDDDDRMRAALLGALGGEDHDLLLLGGGGRYLALSDISESSPRNVLIDRVGEFGRQRRMKLTAGIGPEANDVKELHRALKHALSAFHWAELAEPASGTVVRYEDVAHLRLLPRTALAMSADLKMLIDSLGAVVKYDLDNGTDLAQTLDSFLTSSGSVAKSSTELFIHRNTLRQRIQRIEELISESPEAFEDWVTAGVAVRLIRESESELSDDSGAVGGLRCPRDVMTIGRNCCGLPNRCVLLSGKPTGKR